jgi:hypothetical protein
MGSTFLDLFPALGLFNPFLTFSPGREAGLFDFEARVAM